MDLHLFSSNNNNKKSLCGVPGRTCGQALCMTLLVLGGDVRLAVGPQRTKSEVELRAEEQKTLGTPCPVALFYEDRTSWCSWNSLRICGTETGDTKYLKHARLEVYRG
jgi:hypothetical protein